MVRSAQGKRRSPSRKQVEADGKFFTYNVALNYSDVLLLADAIERAGSADRKAITAAIASSTFAGHIMPYGPTKFVNGQNTGAAPSTRRCRTATSR